MAEGVVDWSGQATLYAVFDGEISYTVHTGSLAELVTMANQGHEAPINQLLIKTQGGLEFAGKEIASLALRPDRPR
jgi:hypothetical protein